MERQEYYLLYPDGKFLRNRKRNGKAITETGTFEKKKSDTGLDYVRLTYSKDSKLRGSCYSMRNDEYLYWKEQEGLYQNNW